MWNKKCVHGATDVRQLTHMMQLVLLTQFCRSIQSHVVVQSVLTGRLLIKATSGVLAVLRGALYGREYASPLHSLRPCCTAFLNSLRDILVPSVVGIRSVFSELLTSLLTHCYSAFGSEQQGRSRTAWLSTSHRGQHPLRQGRV